MEYITCKEEPLQREDFPYLLKAAADGDQRLRRLGTEQIVKEVTEMNALASELGSCPLHHTAFYCGDYTDDRTAEDFYRFLAGEKELKNVEYGPSYIAPKEYGTPGWWYSFRAEGKQTIELFICKAFGSWRALEMRKKCRRMSHAAIELKSLNKFYEMAGKLAGCGHMRRIMLTEEDVAGHTYSHYINQEKELVIELIYDGGKR